MRDKVRVEEKGWGREKIFASTSQYAGKLLVFDEPFSWMSVHFHGDKDETWYVLKGKFKITWIDTDSAEEHHEELVEGDVWHNPPLFPHRLQALEAGSITIEVSTYDDWRDNYRVQPGDSQNKKT